MRARGAFAIAAALLLAGCGSSKPSSPTAADLGRIDFATDHTITVDERGFSPSELTVRAGDVVLLVNRGSQPHSFTADERFDTGRLGPGDETTLVLTEPGRIRVVDVAMPAHTATLTVVER